jgi:N-acetylneuraminic acid mutarotase
MMAFLGNNDFYSFDTDKLTWKQIKTCDIPPLPRDRHVAVVFNRSIFIFGGYDGFNRVNDFYEYNVDSNSWQEVIFGGREGPPTPRHSHSAVVYEDNMYVFGGYDGNYKNDFYKFNFTKNQWTKIKHNDIDTWPSARYRTSCTVVDNKMYMFGGHDGQQQLNDFYFYDFKKKKWSLIKYPKSFEPSPRDSHILVHSEDSIFLFGGSSGWAKSDFYQFRISEEQWQPIKNEGGAKPSCRFCHVGAVVNDKLYIFGGYDGKIRLNDFYFFVISKECDRPNKSMLKFVNNQQFSDVELEFPEEESCDKKRIYAHRIILAKYPYFEKLIDDLCGYEESTEEVKLVEEFPEDWSKNQAPLVQKRIIEWASSFADLGSEKIYSPEEEKEKVSDELESSKDDIEFTEENYTDRLSQEVLPIEDFLSDEEDVDLPLKIKMEEISYDTCLTIMKYIYTDHCEVSLENSMNLFQAAEIFQISKLKDLCERKISSSIDLSNVSQILVQAHMTNSWNLKEMALSFIIEKFDEVSKSEGFLQMVSKYPELTVEVLKRR